MPGSAKICVGEPSDRRLLRGERITHEEVYFSSEQRSEGPRLHCTDKDMYNRIKSVRIVPALVVTG